MVSTQHIDDVVYKYILETYVILLVSPINLIKKMYVNMCMCDYSIPKNTVHYSTVRTLDTISSAINTDPISKTMKL